MAWAGAIAGVAGSLFTGAATANAADYQAEVARNNAVTAGQNADYAARAGVVEAENKSQQGAAKQGNIKASMAANNVDVNSGSAVSVEKGAREEAVTDTATTEHNAMLQAYGYRTQQTGFQAQAGLESQEAESAPVGAALTAGGSFLNAAPNTSNIGGQVGGGIASLFAGS